MKKLLTLMLGLTLAIGSVAVTFAQDAPKKEEEGKKKGKKKEERRRAKEGSPLAFPFRTAGSRLSVKKTTLTSHQAIVLVFVAGRQTRRPKAIFTHGRQLGIVSLRRLPSNVLCPARQETENLDNLSLSNPWFL